jgi:hypothetical protein
MTRGSRPGRAAYVERPALAEKFGVKLLATYVPMTNHMVFAAVEAGDADKVRDVAWQGSWPAERRIAGQNQVTVCY